jgi:hypothetical protein
MPHRRRERRLPRKAEKSQHKSRKSECTCGECAVQILKNGLHEKDQAHSGEKTCKPHLLVGRFSPLGELALRIFLYFFCFDFRKINGQTKNFEKYTCAAKPHGGRHLPLCRTAGASLPPRPTTLSPCRRGVRRQECTSGGRAA